MHFAGPKTVVLIESFEEDLKTVFEATTPMGAVGLRAKRLDLSACDIAFVASREGLPVNEMILERFLAFFRQIPQNVAEQLARNFRAITISIRTGTNVGQSMLDAHFEAMDEKGAAEVNELFLGLVIGAQTTLAALDEPSRQMLPFSIEFAQSALGAMKTEAEGRAVRFTIDKFVGFDQALLSGINQQKTTMQQVRMAQAKFDQLAMLQRYFLAYYQQNKKIPSTLRSEDGKPLLSWRVALLPIMGRQDLFDRFKLDEPWDSESNKALLNSMPPIFQMFGITADETALKTKTAIRMFVSEGTPLADPSLKLEEIKNPQGMMLFAYVMPDFACEWTKPEDMNWNVDKIDAYFGNALMAVSMNGAVDAIPIIPKDSEQANERVAEQRRFIDGFVRGQLLPTAMTEPDASKSESTVQEINKE